MGPAKFISLVFACFCHVVLAYHVLSLISTESVRCYTVYKILVKSSDSVTCFGCVSAINLFWGNSCKIRLLICIIMKHAFETIFLCHMLSVLPPSVAVFCWWLF
jgi:hypothetical protein